MGIEKALILIGPPGGARRWPATNAGAEHLFPIANRPILFHDLEALEAAGVRAATVFSAGEAGRAIRDAVGDGADWGLAVEHAEWDAGTGLPGALAAGREFLDGAPVIVQQGGAFLRERLGTHIAAFGREQLDALALRLVQPAAAAPGYLFSPRAVSILLDDPGADNPVTGVRARGGRAREQRVDGCLPCSGDVDALLECNRRTLERLPPSVEGVLLDECRVQGPVHVHPTAEIRDTLLRGPLIVGPGARIVDAYVGPYTSIGAGAVVEGTEIEHSIVLPQARLHYVGARLESSVIGRGAHVARGFGVPGGVRLAVGDGAEVELR